jgi:predicted transcriptional regulator
LKIHLSPEQEARLSQLAGSKGLDAEGLAQEVLSLYLEHESRFIEAVKRGMASLDGGQYIEHEEVGARIERLLQS